MRTKPVLTIAKREYLSRVKSKGFWIATLLLPIAILSLVVLPSLIAMKSRGSLRLAIVDEVGDFGRALADKLVEVETPKTTTDPGEKQLEKEQTAEFKVELIAPTGDRAQQRAELDRRVLAGEVDAWVWLSAEGLAANEVEYHGESISNVFTQERLERVATEVIGGARLRQAGIDSAKVAELTQKFSLKTTRVLAGGSRQEGRMTAFILAYALFFMLYIVIMLYGQQVMNGVLEEKGSRIVEVILASVQPMELMMGKLLGIGAAGLTQLGIWVAAMTALTAPAIVGTLSLTPDGDQIPQITLGLASHFLVNFLLGFFLFATLYASIGAATNNVQEAQQFVGFLVIFQVAPMFFLIPVINDPDSTRSVVLSMIPLFTPLLMLLRIAVKMPPLWQVLAAYAMTTAFIVFLIWVCARIYRVGILMYGKKPTFKELWRWIRYA